MDLNASTSERTSSFRVIEFTLSQTADLSPGYFKDSDQAAGLLAEFGIKADERFRLHVAVMGRCFLETIRRPNRGILSACPLLRRRAAAGNQELNIVACCVRALGIADCLPQSCIHSALPNLDE